MIAAGLQSAIIRKENPLKTKTIEQTVTFDASPRQVYDAYVDARRHAAFTGAPARLANRMGGKMSAWNGYVSGEMLVLRPGKRIVQTWKSQSWPAGAAESILDIRLVSKGKKTELTMVHSGIPAKPASLAKGFMKGWYESYWEPLRKYLKMK
jgi:activator of HSP90 ATPase